MTASCLALRLCHAAKRFLEFANPLYHTLPKWSFNSPRFRPFSFKTATQTCRRSNPVDVGSTPRSFKCGRPLRMISTSTFQHISSKLFNGFDLDRNSQAPSSKPSKDVVSWCFTSRSARYPMFSKTFTVLGRRSSRLPRWNCCSDYVQISHIGTSKVCSPQLPNRQDNPDPFRVRILFAFCGFRSANTEDVRVCCTRPMSRAPGDACSCDYGICLKQGAAWAVAAFDGNGWKTRAMKDFQAFKRFQECPEAQEQCIRLADGAQRNDLQANTALCTYVDSVDQNATVTNTFAKDRQQLSLEMILGLWNYDYKDWRMIRMCIFGMKLQFDAIWYLARWWSTFLNVGQCLATRRHKHNQ